MQPQMQPNPQGQPAQGQQADPATQQKAQEVVGEVQQMMTANGGKILREMVNAVKDPQVDHVAVLSQALVVAAQGLSSKLGGLSDELLLGAAIAILRMVEQGMQAAKLDPLTSEERKAILRQAIMLYQEQAGGQGAGAPGQPPMPPGGGQGQGMLAQMAGV